MPTRSFAARRLLATNAQHGAQAKTIKELENHQRLDTESILSVQLECSE